MRPAILVALIATAGCHQGPKEPEINHIATAEIQTTPEETPEELLDQTNEYQFQFVKYTSGTEEKIIKAASCKGCHWICEHCEPPENP